MPSPVTANRPVQGELFDLGEPTQLPADTEHTCDGCPSGAVRAKWLIYTYSGMLTLCGHHKRSYDKSKQTPAGTT